MATVWIYALLDPRTKDHRYVGKAKLPMVRYRRHLGDKSSRRLGRWVRSLLAIGLAPELFLLEEVDESCWQEAERYWICKLRGDGCDLTNHTDGGEGLNGADEETRCRMSQATKKRWADPAKRKLLMDAIQSESRRTKISLALTGVKKTPEHISKLPQNQKGRKLTAEHKRRVSEGSKGKRRTKEAIEKTRAANLGNQYGIGNKSRTGQTQLASEREKKSKSLMGRSKSPEHRAKIAAAMKLAWSRRKEQNAIQLREDVRHEGDPSIEPDSWQ